MAPPEQILIKRKRDLETRPDFLALQPSSKKHRSEEAQFVYRVVGSLSHSKRVISRAQNASEPRRFHLKRDRKDFLGQTVFVEEDAQPRKQRRPTPPEIRFDGVQEVSSQALKKPSSRAASRTRMPTPQTITPATSNQDLSMMNWALEETTNKLDKLQAQSPPPPPVEPTRRLIKPLRFRPHQPVKRYHERHPEVLMNRASLLAGTKAKDGEDDDEDSVDSDSDGYVTETYIKVPVSTMHRAAATSQYVLSLGQLVLDTDEDQEHFYGAVDEDDDSDHYDFDEDEDAENHYSKEYPSDPESDVNNDDRVLYSDGEGETYDEEPEVPPWLVPDVGDESDAESDIEQVWRRQRRQHSIWAEIYM